MDSLCADQQQQQHHKFHHSHQLYLGGKKSLREIDIPPRKLLSRRAAAAAAVAHLDSSDHHFFMDSPKSLHHEEAALLQKFLPYNNIDEDDDDDADPYSSDHFRMYEFKVRKCTRSRSHDWTDCPFAHPGEKARRRDPRRFHYSGTVCSEFRRGNCSRGDNCEFAHGVFECWLHPTRYRTEACKDGKNCKRKICFFAHSPRQLRVLPASCHETTPAASSSPVVERKHHRNLNVNPCCMCCHSVSASPTSTLMGMSHLSPPLSPSLSPPLSPVTARFSPVSRYKDHYGVVEPCGLANQFNSVDGGMAGMSYKDALTELMTSLETMQLSEVSPHHHAAAARTSNMPGNLSWIDVNFNNGVDDQPQFIMSPSTPSPAAGTTNKFFHRNFNPVRSFNLEESKCISTSTANDQNTGLVGPDFGWVNDLLT
ncbi:OLC1v1023914C1 [Oldenlandia corymbosa var. corymbosa]|uniref:OLC1v1023914C1 n=1 Tax=Oldenlandia corymbosa var. corymbosa TaxID=529605 RepID=A0AAV1C110_OLDCO|nr:OLC1v1023914C1 [Oldenlandia corymbosa var. corymbosa]